MAPKTLEISFKPQKNEAWVLAILPMRMASVRIPKKMLQKIGSQTLAERSLGRTLETFKNQDQVRVCAAVDDQKLFEILKQKFPEAQIVLTSPEIATGTDRVSAASLEILKSLSSGDAANLKGILNIQGDMPFMDPVGLQKIAEYFLKADPKTLDQFPMATLSQDWPLEQLYQTNSAVKVITNREGGAIYFSRLPIPYGREKIPKLSKTKKNLAPPLGQLHLGVYGYTPTALARFCTQSPTHLELAEGLEQLRALHLGLQILVIPVENSPQYSFRGIDVKEDLSWAKRNLKKFEFSKKSKKPSRELS